jgi:AcrR family transcriptional regulator
MRSISSLPRVSIGKNWFGLSMNMCYSEHACCSIVRGHSGVIILASKWDQELEAQRTNRRNEVLEASRKLFLEKDLPKVTMKEIAAEVGISTVTLYKYYKSIDEIAFEVHYQLFDEMVEYFGEISDKASAYEQIIEWLRRWIGCLREKPEYFRFQALFDHNYRTEYPKIDQVQILLESYKKGGSPLHHLFEQAQNEGSVRIDFSAHELTGWVFNNLMAMAHRLASRGHFLEKEGYVPTVKLMEMTIESIAQFIKKI